MAPQIDKTKNNLANRSAPRRAVGQSRVAQIRTHELEEAVVVGDQHAARIDGMVELRLIICADQPGFGRCRSVNAPLFQPSRNSMIDAFIKMELQLRWHGDTLLGLSRRPTDRRCQSGRDRKWQ